MVQFIMMMKALSHNRTLTLENVLDIISTAHVHYYGLETFTIRQSLYGSFVCSYMSPSIIRSIMYKMQICVLSLGILSIAYVKVQSTYIHFTVITDIRLYVRGFEFITAVKSMP